MPVTRAGGYTNYSTNTSNFIPEIFSGKLVKKFYSKTVFGDIANTDYEGEIKDKGDVVHISTTPDIAINDYEVGMTMVHEQLNSAGADLEINRAKYMSFKVDDVDKMQSHIGELDKWSEESAEKMKIAMDTDMLGAIYSDAAAANAGATAGAISGNINLGVAATPVTISKTNVLDYIIDCETVLEEQNIGEGKWMVIPARMAGMIKKSELKDASLAGDTTSIMRQGNGRLGMIGSFTLYISNNLNVSGGEHDIVFGHKSGLTFASQMVKNRVTTHPDFFGQFIQGLCVYGYEVINDTAIGHGVVGF